MTDPADAPERGARRGTVPGTPQARTGGLARAAKAKPGEMAAMQQQSAAAFNAHYEPGARKLLAQFGGQTKAANYDHEHYAEAMGSKGGRTTLERHGREHMQQLGRRRGAQTDREALAQMGVKGAIAKGQAHMQRMADAAREANAARPSEWHSERVRRSWETRRKNARAGDKDDRTTN